MELDSLDLYEGVWRSSYKRFYSIKIFASDDNELAEPTMAYIRCDNSDFVYPDPEYLKQICSTVKKFLATRG